MLVGRMVAAAEGGDEEGHERDDRDRDRDGEAPPLRVVTTVTPSADGSPPTPAGQCRGRRHS